MTVPYRSRCLMWKPDDILVYTNSLLPELKIRKHIQLTMICHPLQFSIKRCVFRKLIVSQKYSRILRCFFCSGKSIDFRIQDDFASIGKCTITPVPVKWLHGTYVNVLHDSTRTYDVITRKYIPCVYAMGTFCYVRDVCSHRFLLGTILS